MPDEIHRDSVAVDANSTLDDIKRLNADRGHRDARRAFFVEGVRNVVQAVENRFHIETLVYSEKLLIVPIARKMIRELRRSGTPTLPVSPEAFRQISTARHASGVAAVVVQRWSPLHGISPRAGLCWVVVEQVRSEGNLGSLIRTSEAVGGAGFILVGARIDPFHPGIVRASMGALFRRTFVRTNHLSLRNWLRRHRCCAVGASPDGSADFHHFDYPRPDHPRPRRGAPGARAVPARPVLGPRPHFHGRRGRIAQSRRRGEPVAPRGASGDVGPALASLNEELKGRSDDRRRGKGAARSLRPS